MVTFAQPAAAGMDGHAGVIADALTRLVRDGAASWPRSQQTKVGPSDLGHPCLRRHAYQILGIGKVNIDGDPLAATIGNGFHAWAADAVSRAGGGRWLAETRVAVSGTVGGSCDLYDTHTRTVIDWKVVGPTSMRKMRADGPSQQYRVQAHVYGLGFANAGHEPEFVAIAFLPRAGRLDGLHVWSERWDRAVAEDALNRHATLTAVLGLLDGDRDPGRVLGLVPTTPTNCQWCDWFNANATDDLITGCPGG